MQKIRRHGKTIRRLSADIDSALLARLKTYCAREGKTIRGVVIRGIVREMDGRTKES